MTILITYHQTSSVLNVNYKITKTLMIEVFQIKVLPSFTFSDFMALLSLKNNVSGYFRKMKTCIQKDRKKLSLKKTQTNPTH